jgi:hypothetical protein
MLQLIIRVELKAVSTGSIEIKIACPNPIFADEQYPVLQKNQNGK